MTAAEQFQSYLNEQGDPGPILAIRTTDDVIVGPDDVLDDEYEWFMTVWTEQRLYYYDHFDGDFASVPRDPPQRTRP